MAIGASTSESEHKPAPVTPGTQPSTLQTIKRNGTYLIYGSASSTVPSSLRTRSALNTTRYIVKFAFWRLVRYAKYAAIGAIITTFGGGLIGTLASGAGFFLAPSFAAGIGIGIGVAIVKFGWRHRPDSLRHLPFISQSAAHTHSHASSKTISSTEPSTRQKGFLDWARSRAEENADAREDEREDSGDEQETRRQRNKRVRGDVWMRA